MSCVFFKYVCIVNHMDDVWYFYCETSDFSSFTSFLVDIIKNTIRSFDEVFYSFDRQQMHVEQPQQSAMYQQQPAPQMYPSMQQQSKLLIQECFMYEMMGVSLYRLLYYVSNVFWVHNLIYNMLIKVQ